MSVASPSPTDNQPMYRPNLLGKGPNSLIDRIDTQDLMKKGQKDALIMFNCAVRKDGGVEWSATYRGTPGSDFLKQELQKRISPASDPRFIPAVYNHRPRSEERRVGKKVRSLESSLVQHNV